MATIFNKRLFGTDLDPEIKNKLRARQLVGKHSILPNTSNQFVSIQGQDYNISDLIGDVNFGFDNDKLSLGDLSSRTPFARMWTAVELYWSQPDIYGDDYGQATYTTTQLGVGGQKAKWKKHVNKQMKQNAEAKSFEKKSICCK